MGNIFLKYNKDFVYLGGGVFSCISVLLLLIMIVIFVM